MIKFGKNVIFALNQMEDNYDSQMMIKKTTVTITYSNFSKMKIFYGTTNNVVGSYM